MLKHFSGQFEEVDYETMTVAQDSGECRAIEDALGQVKFFPLYTWNFYF